MNFDDPRNQGLLALAAGLMAPSRGGSFGGAAAQGLQGYQQAYGNASNVRSQSEQMKMQRELFDIKKAGAARDAAKQAERDELIKLLMPQMQQPNAAPAQMRPSPQEASGLYQPPPMMGEQPPMGGQQSPMGQPPAMGGGQIDEQRRKQIMYRLAATSDDPLKALQDLMKPPETYVVNGRVFEKGTNREIREVPQQTPAYNPYRDLVGPEGPNTPLIKARESVAEKGAMRVQIPGQQRAEDSKEGEYLVKDFYENVVPVADVARGILPQLDSMSRSLDNADFETGFAPEVRKTIAEGLGFLGSKKAQQAATGAQEFNAAMSEIVLQKQQAQKGPQTENDARRIEATTAALGNTPDANKFLIAVSKAQAKRDIAREQFYADWKAKKRSYEGARSAWNSGPGGTSLFDTPDLLPYKGVRSGEAKERPPLESFFK